ncbi:cytochrome P450 81D11 [Prunus yedoensis var. nudiflora]|uniref:Cytochrome P450 81D11 n=1 Tax=Prunus yedoensis var. nudiflora TaxID=2094558 RepID=A0A314XPJ8_PRUYE|nr:cytochrome P450 81D11 [Prunus yedoensis var. nudiflora]
MKKSCTERKTKIELKSKFTELSFNVMTMMVVGKRLYGENVLDVEEAKNIQKWIDITGIEKKMGLVEERREILSTKCGSNGKEVEKLMIDNLLALQETEPQFYTDEIIKGIILVMLVAGTDTSSTALDWAMALLLNHPETMEKVRAEIETKIGQERLLEEQDLPKLTYLQKDPEVWEDPTRFEPERFEGWNGDGSEGYKLIAFGAGRRGCPGAALANRLIGLALGTWIQSFEWERISEENVDMSEGLGLSMPRAQPLEAMCKPRPIMFSTLKADTSYNINKPRMGNGSDAEPSRGNGESKSKNRDQGWRKACVGRARLAKAELLQNVINEALRLYQPVPFSSAS